MALVIILFKVRIICKCWSRIANCVSKNLSDLYLHLRVRKLFNENVFSIEFIFRPLPQKKELLIKRTPDSWIESIINRIKKLRKLLSIKKNNMYNCRTWSWQVMNPSPPPPSVRYPRWSTVQWGSRAMDIYRAKGKDKQGVSQPMISSFNLM